MKNRFVAFLMLLSFGAFAETTLYQRMSGDIGENDSRIPIHGIQALINEVDREYRDVAYIVAEYDLTVDQEADLVFFIDKMLAKKDKAGFSVFLFDWLALAELKATGYVDEEQFWIRVDADYN